MSDYLSKGEVIECVNQRGELRIAVSYNSVTLEGVAVCDPLSGGMNQPLVRAKFGHSIKAILKLEEYGRSWKAERP